MILEYCDKGSLQVRQNGRNPSMIDYRASIALVWQPCYTDDSARPSKRACRMCQREDFGPVAAASVRHGRQSAYTVHPACVGGPDPWSVIPQGGIDRGWFRSPRSTKDGKPHLPSILSIAADIASAMTYLHAVSCGCGAPPDIAAIVYDM